MGLETEVAVTVDIQIYEQIMDDPGTEAEALRKRCYRYLEDSQHITNRPQFHAVYALIGICAKIRDEWEYAADNAANPSAFGMQDYWQAALAAKRVVMAQVLGVIHGQLDELEKHGQA